MCGSIRNKQEREIMEVLYSIDELVKRYNDSVSDYAAYTVAVNEHDTEKQAKHLRDAGEGFSQVIEHAIRMHIKQCDSSRYRYYDKSPLPKIINELYLNDENEEMDLFLDFVGDIEPSVDFAFVRDNKHDLTNASKHQGGIVNPYVVEEYSKQCKLFIHEYLDPDAQLRDVAYYMEAPQDSIQQFYVACDHFNRINHTFILLTERQNNIDKRYFQNFATAPWDVIYDFDKHSMEAGFGLIAYQGGTEIKHIYKAGDAVTSDDFPANIMKPVYFFANGYKNEKACSDFEEWNRYYYSKVDKFTEAISRSIITQKTIVVSLLNDEDFVENLRSMMARHFTNVKFVIANDPKDELLGLTKKRKNNYEHISSTIEDINKCLSDYLKPGNQTSNDETYNMPYLQGEGNGILTKGELQDLEECFEVLYKSIGDGTDENSDSFLRGEVALTWQGAKRNFAAQRERFSKMYVKRIEAEIKKGRSKVFIIHEPGFGGSTVARQTAYELHESYPVLYLKEFRSKSVIQKLDWLHEKTKKTIVIFMEIPSVISQEDFDYIYKNTNQSRPYVFVGVKRGLGSNNDIPITDWGNDTILLADKFKPIIEERYMDSKREEKMSEINRILTSDVEVYKRTPFYFGMLAYEKDFIAANGYFEKFARVVEGNEAQKKCLLYLAICDYYADRAIPEAFFKTIFGVGNTDIFKLEDYFDETEGVFDSLIQTENVGNARQIRLKYAYFSKMFMMKLLKKDGMPEDTGWMDDLGAYCKDFINESAESCVANNMQDEILQPLFIGSSREREGEEFTELVENIRVEDRINIFVCLHEQFPDNPHFCSHLARYYAMKEKNMEYAIEFADRAIRLSQNPDPLLHHIKGMCLYYIISDRIEKIKKRMKYDTKPTQEEISEIIGPLLTQAEREFAKSREIQKEIRHEDEYGYIPNIKLLLRIFDFYVLVNNEKKREVIGQAKEPYVSWLDKAHALLSNAERLHEEGEESEHYITCETSLWQEYEDYSSLIEKLNNQLGKVSHTPLVRRQLARVYMKRDNDYMITPRANERILALMGENMKTDIRNISNFLLWFKAARYSNLTTDEILTKLVQWKALYPAIDFSFYCYVLNTIKAIEGSTDAATQANKYIKECHSMGGGNKIYIKEWYGESPQGLINYSTWKENPDSYHLFEVTGYVSRYEHSGKAIIQMDCGLDVFFKPSLNGLGSGCQNHNVKFCLGFSYDGLRAKDGSVVLI